MRLLSLVVLYKDCEKHLSDIVLTLQHKASWDERKLNNGHLDNPSAVDLIHPSLTIFR